MMPGLDGLTMTRQLKADPELASIPVILLTARGGTHAEVEGLEAGADDYLTKPFAPRVLEARVRGLFALQERLRARLDAERRAAERRATKTTEREQAAAAEPSAPPAPPEAPAPTETSAPEGPHTEAARTIMRRHLGDPDFGVAELADALGTTRSTLYRRLRAEGSPSPSDLLRTMRLEEAARLLEAGAGNVTQVAYAVGYANLAAFSRAFREHFGTTPSQRAAA
jgi:AraC-like DNA-binding protein